MDLFSRSFTCVKEGEKEKTCKEVAAPTSGKYIDHTNSSFASTGLYPWICQGTEAMGFRRPTKIQAECIPAILADKDVMACAETGSGKTCAFALPILQKLSEDPYGIYAVVLTPTRELAVQISEQIAAFGAAIGVKIALIIGGSNVIEQGLALSKRPHFVIATPGRLRHHLEGSSPPDLSKAKFLCLDEADRLLAGGFSSELDLIISSMSNPRRRTLLFSATLTESMAELEKLALDHKTMRFDLTVKRKVPVGLSQQYLFMPKKVKLAYLCAVLRKCSIPATALENIGKRSSGSSTSGKKRERGATTGRKSKQDSAGGTSSSNISLAAVGGGGTAERPDCSVIVFVGTCRRCEEVYHLLDELGIACESLHSIMDQTNRLASLARFKSQQTKVLICTDVASRGLDIPEVNLVINFDLPRITEDYIHRIGRAARAGRSGTALSFVTESDIDLLHSIEAFTAITLTAYEGASDEDVLPLLNPVSKAMHLARMKLLDSGFDDKAEKVQKRRRKQERQLIRSSSASGGGKTSSNDSGTAEPASS